MKGLRNKRGLVALGAAVVGLVIFAAIASGAATIANVGPTKKTLTFNFQAGANSKTQQLFSVDGLSANARCDSKGGPVIFAFSSVNHADVFGHMVDGSGRLHVIANDNFTKKSKGVSLAPNTSGDRDASGAIEFEQSNGDVVTVNYGFDNSKTLANLNVCTVFGTIIAT